MSKPPETYTQAEAEVRREAALKVMLATPHQKHKPLGVEKNQKKKPQ